MEGATAKLGHYQTEGRNHSTPSALNAALFLSRYVDEMKGNIFLDVLKDQNKHRYASHQSPPAEPTEDIRAIKNTFEFLTTSAESGVAPILDVSVQCGCNKRNTRTPSGDRTMAKTTQVVKCVFEERYQMSINGMTTLVDHVETIRQAVNNDIDPEVRTEFAQFMTPPPVSRLMASMFDVDADEISLLDPGAGVGSLTAAFVEFVCSLDKPPETVRVVAYEIDPILATSLRANLRRCREECEKHGITFKHEVKQDDFLACGLFNQDRFDFILMNPPYRKINSKSETRKLLRAQGIETSNLYTAFMAVAARQLADQGQFVSITPRSFCNGTYFRSFRRDFLRSMSFQRIHVYESRSTAFAGDEVLQENVIISARKTPPPKRATISTTTRSGEKSRTVPYRQIVHPEDPEAFIRIVTDRNGEHIAKDINALPCIIHQLGVEVSTGRVVDFRAKEHLRDEPGKGTAPLIYPCHLKQGSIEWPISGSKKPNAIASNDDTATLFVPSGIYVLVKRFSAKEEKRRVVASVFRPSDAKGKLIGFENHTNYYHDGGAGMDEMLAVGLATYLNSTVFDQYFRIFSGHTQVNATDLRSVPYPSRDVLIQLGESTDGSTEDQDTIDALIEQVVFGR